jgi:phosphatidylglycerophosphate synthase
MDRRPLKVRRATWAQMSAAWLARVGATPNQISILSFVFAVLAFVTFSLADEQRLYLLIAPVLVLARLICNLLDGMVAVEHKKSSPNGELFNDVPDRFADIFIILGVGLAIRRPEAFPFAPIQLAWIASVVAVITAYVRVLGKSLGTQSYFIGPMAKQHRMFLVMAASVVEFVSFNSTVAGMIFYLTLILLSGGGLFTVFRRLSKISSDLQEMKHD